jgi:hypothetical protein
MLLNSIIYLQPNNERVFLNLCIFIQLVNKESTIRVKYMQFIVITTCTWHYVKHLCMCKYYFCMLFVSCVLYVIFTTNEIIKREAHGVRAHLSNLGPYRNIMCISFPFAPFDPRITYLCSMSESVHLKFSFFWLHSS